MAFSQPAVTVAPKLVSVSYSGNDNTITLHFDRTVTAGNGNLVISNGHSQSYVGANGLSSRIVGATDTRTLDDSDGQISYSTTDGTVTIHLNSALHSGESYSVTMDAGAVQDAATSGAIGRISATTLFNFTASGNASVPATPAAAVGAAIHFTDTGASSSDYITASLEQQVTGTYSGSLDANEFIQVSLDNGASWHQAFANADNHTWNYSGSIDTGNLASGADGNLNGALLARVSNTAGGSSATASQAYVYSNHPIEVSVNPTVSFSDDTGSDRTDLITNTASQTVSGIYEGVLHDGQTLQISVDNGSTWINASASAGIWQASNITLLEGKHGMQMRVTDTMGNASNTAYSEYTLISSGLGLNGRALTLASDNGASNADGVTNAISSVSLNVSNLHGVHVGNVFQVIDTSNNSVVGSYTIQSGDLYYGTGDYLAQGYNDRNERTALNISVDGVFSDGAQHLAVRLVDIAGNVGTSSSIVDVTLDATPPVVQSSAISGSTITLTFSEAVNLNNDLSFQISDGNDTSAGTQILTVEASQVSVSNNTVTLNLSSSLDPNSHYSVTLRSGVIFDTAGNSAYPLNSTLMQFTTDGTAPQLSGIALSNDSGVTGDYVTNVAEQTLNGVYSGTLGAGDHIEVSLDGGAWTAASIDSSTWSLATTLTEGAHTVEVRVASNHATVISQAITLDTTPPAAQIVPSATSFPYTSEVQTITGQYSSATGLLDEIVLVSLDNGATYQKATLANVSTGISSWSVTGVVLNGLIDVQISDAAGNLSNYSDSGRNVIVIESNAGTSFDTSSGSAPVFGGSSNNTFNLQDPNHNILSGGAGVDTVTLRFNNATLPLAKLFGIEVINMSPTYQSVTYGSNTIFGINPDNVTAMTDLISGVHKLQIDGNGTNNVYLGSGWSADNPSENSGYHTYHANSDSSIVLLIGSAINIQTSA
ncbi:hypothetical protein GJ697_27630 [Pseudoduganella sp. FT25W]|uniref:Ig-like domain-containing protein n=1 Tax=Duganella alba TaxID=2666081 RepID=A0A6L5QP37_9BURK|nr:Ig-like domain-containing protein [Duganella alba]MRX11603.1 hypothetical protein [Duganella alba]MRX19984.1 hypothetical protein [Duganella alba]